MQSYIALKFEETGGDPLTAWDKVGIPLQLRASQLNNLKTTSPNFIKIEIGFSRKVSNRIPKYHKICAHEWRSAPD